MKIFLDPGFDNNCTVRFDNGNIQTLHGTIEENCMKIRNFVLSVYEDEDGKEVRIVQDKEVYLDSVGFGQQYSYGLDMLGVKYEKCTYNKIIY